MFSLLFPGDIFPQGLKKSGMPLEVLAKPSVTVPGGKVKLVGSATKYKNNRVNALIVTPRGTRKNLSSYVQSDRSFSINFRDTQELGTYRVTVTGPGGQGRKTLNFQVITFSNQNRNIAQKFQRNLRTLGHSIVRLESIAKNAPATPAQKKLKKKLSALKDPLNDVKEQVSKLESGLKGLAKVAEDYPELAPDISPIFERFSSALASSDMLNQGLSDSTRQAESNRSLCDGLNYTSKAIKTASLLFTASSGALDAAINVVKGLSVDSLVSKLPVDQRTPHVKLTIDYPLSRAIEMYQKIRLPSEVFGSSLADLVPFVAEGVFDRFCEKYTGPVKATLNVTVKEKGKSWWKYSVKLDAKINIRYRKGSQGASIPVTGEIEGVASKFTTWEDFTVLDPRVKKDVLVRFHVPPVPGNLTAVDTIGLGGAATPKYFRIPLRGNVTGNKISISLESATVDYKAQTKVYYVLVNPAIPFPHVLTTSLPYQKAHFIITRVLGANPKFNIEVDNSNNVSRIRKNASRNAKMKGGNIIIKIRANVKACNPECP